MNDSTTALLLGLTILGVALVTFVWLCALIDCLRSDFRRSGDKIAWLLAVILLPLLGALLYWTFATHSKHRRGSHAHSHARNDSRTRSPRRHRRSHHRAHHEAGA